MPDTLPPEACTTMTQVREGVDALDAQLVALLAMRFGYMRAASQIKSDRAAVRDEDRKAAVIAAACREAEARGLPPQAIADVWERLVEASIAYELALFDARIAADSNEPTRAPA